MKFKDEIDKILLEHKISDEDRLILKDQLVHLLKSRIAHIDSHIMIDNETLTENKDNPIFIDQVLEQLEEGAANSH